MIEVLEYYPDWQFKVRCGESTYMIDDPFYHGRYVFHEEMNIYHALWQVTACEIAILERVASLSAMFSEVEKKEQAMPETLQQQFDRLADAWERETRCISDAHKIAYHPCALEIADMGKEVVPMILSRMQTRPWFWFGILEKLTGARPTTDAMRGKMQELTEAWLEWGRKEGYLS